MILKHDVDNSVKRNMDYDKSNKAADKDLRILHLSRKVMKTNNMMANNRFHSMKMV